MLPNVNPLCSEHRNRLISQVEQVAQECAGDPEGWRDDDRKHVAGWNAMVAGWTDIRQQCDTFPDDPRVKALADLLDYRLGWCKLFISWLQQFDDKVPTRTECEALRDRLATYDNAQKADEEGDFDAIDLLRDVGNADNDLAAVLNGTADDGDDDGMSSLLAALGIAPGDDSDDC